MVSWQAFPFLPPRAPPAFLSGLKLPFRSLSNACHAGYAGYAGYADYYYHLESQQGQLTYIKVQTLFINIFMTLFAIQQHSWTTLGWIRQTLMRLYNQLSVLYI